MNFKVQILIEGKWITFTWETLNETILFGNDLSTYKKRFWTGIKDRNGKEIYEGDIIGRRGMKNTFVEYEGCRWVLRYDEPKIEWRQDLHNQTSLHLEVIGNIYENSDLLP